MTKDYKDRVPTPRKPGAASYGPLWFFAGTALGGLLIGAGVVWLKLESTPPAKEVTPIPKTEKAQSIAPIVETTEKPQPETSAAPPKLEFEYDRLLRNAEVTLPEPTQDTQKPTQPPPAIAPPPIASPIEPPTPVEEPPTESEPLVTESPAVVKKTTTTKTAANKSKSNKRSTTAKTSKRATASQDDKNDKDDKNDRPASKKNKQTLTATKTADYADTDSITIKNSSTAKAAKVAKATRNLVNNNDSNESTASAKTAKAAKAAKTAKAVKAAKAAKAARTTKNTVTSDDSKESIAKTATKTTTKTTSKRSTTQDTDTIEKPKIQISTPPPSRTAVAPPKPPLRSKSTPKSTAAAKPAADATVTNTRQNSAVIQLGAFKNEEDVKRLKARMALMGIETRIETATTKDNKTIQRLRTSPYSDKNELKEARRLFNRHNIKTLVIQHEHID